MSPAPEMTDAQTAELVVRTLASQAREATIPTLPFDPTRHTSFTGVDAGGPELVAPGRRRGRGPLRGSGRVRWLAPLAAAAVAVVVVAVGMVVAGHDDQPRTRTERNPIAQPPTDTPDGALLPGWLPEGLVPWGGGWGRPGPVMIPNGTLQLFKGEGDAVLMIEFQPPNLHSSGGEPVTVRGVEGGLTRPPDETSFAPGFLHWREGNGNTNDVIWQNMRAEDVIAFLDGLTWRGPDNQDGFVPPTGGDLRLVGEVRATATQAVTTEFLFGDPASPPRTQHEGRYLWMQTSSATGRADDFFYLNWLATDGEGEVPSLGGDPDEEIDPGMAAVSWPDGRTVMIRSRGVSQDELRRVVDSIAAGTGQDLDRLHAAIGERLAALPLVGQAALPSGTVEMRDGGGDDRAACLHLPAREPACGWLGFTPDTEGPDLGLVQASVTIDGTWYALAVATKPVELTSEDPLNPTTLVLANETGTDGPYYFALALPPPEMQHVALHLDGGLLSYLSRPETEYFPGA